MLLGWQPFWGALVQLNPTYQALPLGNITSYCVLSYVGVYVFIVYMCLMFPECLLGGGGGSDCLKRKKIKMYIVHACIQWGLR